MRKFNNSSKPDSSRFLDEIMREMPLVFYLLDKNGVIVTAEGSALSEFHSEDVLNKSAMQVFSNDPQLLQLIFLLEENRPFSHTIAYKDKVINFIHSPIAADKDYSNHNLLIGVDLTQQKATRDSLSESREDFNLLLDALPDFYFRVDINGLFTSVKIGQEFGPLLRNWNLSDSSLENVFGVEISSTLQGIIFACKEAQRPGIFHSDWNSAVGPKYLEFRIMPAQQRDVLVVVRDMTREKQYEQELEQTNLLLKSEVVERIQLEGELEKTEAEFQALFNSAYHLASSLSLQGIVQNVNGRVLELQGLAKEELVGSFIWETPVMKKVPESVEALKRAVQLASQGEFSKFEIRTYDQNENPKILELSVVPIRKEGSVHHILVEGYDITENKKIQQELSQNKEMLELFIKHAPAAIAMYDRNMICLSASDRWKKDFGVPDVEIVGKSHYAIFPDLPERWKANHKKVQTGEVLSAQEELWEREDGSRIWINWESHPWLKSNGQIGGIIIFTEIVTEQVEARKLLEVKTQQLSTSNKALEQFTYMTSHDLKEPLRSITSFSQLLERKLDAGDTDVKEYLDFIVTNAKRMHGLIEGLLQYSTVKNDGQEFQKINTQEALDNAISSLHYAIKESRARIRFDKLPDVKAHALQLQQVFQNLISNSIKFKLPILDPLIVITSERKDGFTLFSIKDNGRGFDMAYADQIFMVFKHLQAKDKAKGSGIGLSVCKKIIQGFGGKIWAEAKPNSGATFYFTIPD